MYIRFMKLNFALVISFFLALVTSSYAGKFTETLEGDLVAFDGKKVEEVAKGSLTGKTVFALYFSAHWCPPCRAFTPTLPAVYTELTAKYPHFELILISRDKSERDMDEYMKWGKMNYPAIDFKALDKYQLLKDLSVDGIPYMIVVDAEGTVLSSRGKPLRDGPASIVQKLDYVLAQTKPSQTAAVTTKTYVGKVTNALEGILVISDGKKTIKVPKGSLTEKTVFAFFYAANWHAECRSFAPTLAPIYTELKAKYPFFELVFVSSDRNARDMENFMLTSKMNFPAINYDDIGNRKIIEELATTAMPYLVVVDANGNQLAGRGAKDYVLPSIIMEELRKILADPKSQIALTEDTDAKPAKTTGFRKSVYY